MGQSPEGAVETISKAYGAIPRSITASLPAGANEKHANRRKLMLKVGDRVYIDGTREEGTVKDVRPHEIVVRVTVPGGHEERTYAHEDLRLDPTLNEASNYRDR